MNKRECQRRFDADRSTALLSDAFCIAKPTAGAQRAPRGEGSRSEVVLPHPRMTANSDGLSQSPPDLPSSARRSRLEVAPAIQRAS